MSSRPEDWLLAGFVAILWPAVALVEGVGGPIGGAPEALALALGILIVASAIYYAMLIYAPRQIMEGRALHSSG
jgi:hypothetical protein